MRFGGLILAVSLVLVAGIPSVARAGDTDDTVLLKNGGRVRGTVLVEDPDSAVIVKVADGTTRVIKFSDVQGVQYGAQPTAPAVAPAPAPVAVPVAPASIAVPKAPTTAPVTEALPPPRRHRRKELLWTGVIVMGVGAGTALAGVVAAGAECWGDYFSRSCDSGGKAPPVLMTAGVLIAAAGAPFFILGLIKVPDHPAEVAGNRERSAALLTVAPAVFANDTFGLKFAGSM